jgi:transcriptional regulator
MKNNKLNNSELYDQYLIAYQLDMRKIVSKFKKSFHALSNDEIYSECNLHLVQAKEKILNSLDQGEELTQPLFNKIAYHYVKNECSWSHYRLKNKAYEKRKVDSVINTEDGLKTTFEAAIETSGENNKEIDNDDLFFNANCKHFLHVLTKYCYLLTEKECKVLSFIQKGFNQEQISIEFGVTKQAVSALFIGMREKLNQFFDFNEVLNGGDSRSIEKGKESINNFFVNKINRTPKQASLKIYKQKRNSIKHNLIST